MNISNTESSQKINIEALYKEHNSHLKKFISVRVWNPDDVDEVVQLTFLEAVRCQDKFKGNSKPETWLFGIADNLTRNYFKHYYRHPQTEEMTESLLDELQAEIETDPALLHEYERTLERTVEAMGRLPEQTQNILNMVVDSELSYQEAADAAGMPIGTIRSRLSRARQTLKNCFA